MKSVKKQAKKPLAGGQNETAEEIATGGWED